MGTADGFRLVTALPPPKVTISTANAPTHRLSLPAVPWPVLAIAGLMVAGLLAVSGAYGFHGDEMYYIVAGQHPAFGYVDQPPLTPLLSAASVALLGVSPTAVRVLAAIEMGLIVVLVALMARDLGGSRRAQVLAAITAALSGYLAGGHLDTTSEPDLLAWAIILWLLVKLLAGGDRRLWLAVGVTTGIGLENKDTLLLLGAGLAVGLVLARRWDVVRSPWAWAAIGIALLIWVPNLAWQATNGWPEVTMAHLIAGYAADNRAQIVPLLWLFTAGRSSSRWPAAGLAWVLLAKTAAPWRAIGIASVVALVLVVVSGGKAYYAVGSLAVFIAAGAGLLDHWLARGHLRLKAASFGAAAAISGALVVIPDPADPPGRHVRQIVAPIGGPDPGRAGRLAAVRRHGGGGLRLTARTGARPRGDPDQRLQRGEPARAARDGTAPGLLGPQRVLGLGTPAGRPTRSWCTWVTGDRPTGARSSSAAIPSPTIDNGLGIANSMQGELVWVCTGLRQPWSAMWPELRTIS